uniref:Reverse transcriptase/retrotransposon-derived protein RNase H-like domain-containing protein n=1 Tax=Moniliophthora roreri TaxID=221103 RepID=A0A0W0G5A5_MONRR
MPPFLHCSKKQKLMDLLNDLTKKAQKFEWTAACQIAFNLLKWKFLSKLILVMLDTDKLFIIEVDALKWATGAVLHQQGMDGKWHPCGYLSKSLSPTEWNYKIYDQELLAINGAETQLEAGQMEFVPIRIRSGSDTLSQRSNEWEEEDMDNENVVMLLDSLFMKGINLEMQSEIMEWLGLDDFHKLALEQLLNQGMLPIKSVLSDWKIDVRLLFF